MMLARPGCDILIPGCAEYPKGIAMVVKLQPSVGFVSIEIGSLAKSKGFYEALAKALDLEPVYEGEDYKGWGNKEFHLIISEEDRARVKRGKPTGKEPEGVADCVGIWLPDKKSVDTVMGRLKKAGIDPLYPPELIKEWGNYYTVSYCDPDNFVIEIFHTPE
jgi:predicted lactoylglutathione lyase